jgi:serine/threonine-protein kinase HipA
MSSICSICLEPMDSEGEYHDRCIRRLFRTKHVPKVEVQLAKLHSLGLAMAGRTTISGAQRKISVGLSSDRMTLQLALQGGLFILKPASESFPALPNNELLSMRIAEAAGVEVPPCGLVRLADGSAGYVIARFDRTRTGRKVRQEDFCQLADKPPKEKYSGSAELCVRLLRRYATEPPIEILRWFRLLLVGWWTGNGDMHLKNFSLTATEDGTFRLSPAYDLVCTQLYIDDDPLALPVGGKRSNVSARKWLELATYCGLPAKAARRVFTEIASAESRATALVTRSGLPEDMQQLYVSLLGRRGEILRSCADKLSG